MRVVLPFLLNDENDLDSPKVSGGLERFSQLIYQNSPAEIIPFYYTREDRKARSVTNKLVSFIHNIKPDLVISNQDSVTITTNVQKLVDVPILWISHTASGGIFKIPQLDSMEEFVSNGGTLAMVSEWQYLGMNKLSTRVRNKELILNGGLINSAFCSGDEFVSTDINYDCVTIGRIDKEKDPFLLHRLTAKSDIKTLVLTSAYDLIPSQQEYYNENQHWSDPKHTKYNLPYLDVMSELSSCAAYFSTCSRETWGITALEAFSRGVPVILIKTSANDHRHASEDIAPGTEYYATINAKNTKTFTAALKTLDNVDRYELSQKTKEKHSKINWLNCLVNLMDKAVENKKQHIKPVSWFD